MGKVRIPLDIDEDLKQDFIDRLESHHGFEGKVKINTMLQNLMLYVIGADEFELGELLFKAEGQRENYAYYKRIYQMGQDLGLFEGLDIKRGNPRKGEVEYNLNRLMAFENNKENIADIKKSLAEIDRKIKADEVFEEDKENYMDKKKRGFEYVSEFGFKKPY